MGKARLRDGKVVLMIVPVSEGEQWVEIVEVKTTTRRWCCEQLSTPTPDQFRNGLLTTEEVEGTHLKQCVVELYSELFPHPICFLSTKEWMNVSGVCGRAR